MLAAYGVDVLDPAVTCRRVWVLLNRLPPSARDLGEVWGAEAQLLALLVDHLANLTYITLKAHGAKSVSKPRPVPRPRTTQVARVQPAAASTASRSGGSWLDAAAQLAKIPGVAVKADADG